MSTTARTACPHAARETSLTLTNNSAFYDTARELISQLATRVDCGTYSAEKALKAVENLIVNALRQKEWTVVYGVWKPTPADRKLAAVEILEHYKEQIVEMAEELAGPEYVAVRVASFDHDMYGNPTAQHVVFTSTEDGGTVRRLSADWKPRRVQVGYGDYLEGCTDAMKKAGVTANHYERVKVDGDRSGDEIVAVYKRRPFTI